MNHRLLVEHTGNTGLRKSLGNGGHRRKTWPVEGPDCERVSGGERPPVRSALSGRRLRCQDLFLKLSLDARPLRREAGVTVRSAGLHTAAAFCPSLANVSITV